MAEKKKHYVKIGTIGHGRLSLNDAITEVIKKNPNQVPQYDPIDACISPASQIIIHDLSANSIEDPNSSEKRKK